MKQRLENRRARWKHLEGPLKHRWWPGLPGVLTQQVSGRTCCSNGLPSDPDMAGAGPKSEGLKPKCQMQTQTRERVGVGCGAWFFGEGSGPELWRT